MNHTVELLVKIKEMLLTGKLSLEQVPIEGIKECLMSEIQLNRNTFLESQYDMVMQQLQVLCANIDSEEQDATKVLMFLDASILCVNMISEAVKTLANGEYWYYKHNGEMNNPEIAEIVDYVGREGEIHLLNYDFVKKYQASDWQVYTEEESGMMYIPYRGRKMFFPRGWTEEHALDYFVSVITEQDKESPHCYNKEGYEVQNGDVVVDAGAAEGIFALDIIDRAKKIYLIEADEQWVEALKQTFKDDMDKVEIIYGFLGNEMMGNKVSIDGLFEREEINYIKMDIEGYEKNSILGAMKTIERNSNIICAVCAYHCKDDETWLTYRFKEMGMSIDTSRGYICPDWTISAYLEAELRRGIVFGKKGC